VFSVKLQTINIKIRLGYYSTDIRLLVLDVEIMKNRLLFLILAAVCVKAVSEITVNDGVPNNFSVIGLGPKKIKLQWDPPVTTACNGSLSYSRITRDGHSSSDQEVFYTRPTETYMVMDDLTRSSVYRFKVQTVSDRPDCFGPWSRELSYRTSGQPLRPSPPENLKVEVFHQSSNQGHYNNYRHLNISWSPPSNSPIPVEHYDIEYRTDGNWVLLGKVVDRTWYVATTASGRAKYRFRVISVVRLESEGNDEVSIVRED